MVLFCTLVITALCPLALISSLTCPTRRRTSDVLDLERLFASNFQREDETRSVE